MSNRIENAVQMKNQTWSTEIEAYGITPKQALMVIGRHYGTTGTYEYNPDADWDKRHHLVDNQGRDWYAHHDGSVQDNGYDARMRDDRDFELTMPPFTYDEIEDFQQIVRELRQAGAYADARHMCGLHIHIGAFNTTDGGAVQDARSIRNLLNIVKSHEDLLVKAINISDNRIDYYTHRMSDDFFQVLRTNRPTDVPRLVHLYNNYHDRYTMVNLNALRAHTTIEFRFFEFHHNLHAGEMKAYIHLCLAMCNYAKLVSYCSPEKVDMSNEKYAMKNWLNNLGLIGDEFKTTRKMLTKRLSGDLGSKNPRQRQSNIDDADVEVDG